MNIFTQKELDTNRGGLDTRWSTVLRIGPYRRILYLSCNTIPLMIIGVHFSILEVRVPDCLAFEKCRIYPALTAGVNGYG